VWLAWVTSLSVVVIAIGGIAFAVTRCRKRASRHTQGMVLELNNKQPVQHRLQITFTAADAMHAMKYRDMVDSHTAGWRCCELLLPGIDDTTWFEHWCRDLDRASGCLVVLTSNYRARVSLQKRTALRMEAEAILARMRRDQHFKLFALDPNSAGQDYANLKLYLELDVQSMDVESWREFIARRRQGIVAEDIVQSVLTFGTGVGRRETPREESGGPSTSTQSPSSELAHVAAEGHSQRQLQMTFTSDDEVHANNYRDMVNTNTSGWRASDRLIANNDGMTSSSCFEIWKRDLNQASGCLVVFTTNYRTCVTSYARTALRKQAKAILTRIRRDRRFRLFVLDPDSVGQDYANLKLYLELDVQSMNVVRWRDVLAQRPRPAGASLESNVHRLRNLYLDTGRTCGE